jgi:predicted HicB family RNase H-like nuclease
MTKRSLKKNAQTLLILARELAQTPGLNWIDASNAIFSPNGPFVRLFPTKEDRVAFGKMDESRQIDDLLEDMPEPPVREEAREYSGRFNVRIPKSLHAALVREADTQGVSLNQLVLAKLALHLNVR